MNRFVITKIKMLRVLENSLYYYKYFRINIIQTSILPQRRKLTYQSINANGNSQNRFNKAGNCNCKWNNLLSFVITSNIRNKYTKGSKQEEDSDSDDEFSDSFKDEKDSKIVKTRVNSLRADLILKAGLGIARNKVETIFYESKIRVNGRKLPKKSVQLEIGDEIDVIKGFSDVNPSHLVVARVVILSATEKEDNLLVNLRRFKSLLIENYENVNSFKTSEQK